MNLSTTKTQRDYYNRDREITCDRLCITQNDYNRFRRVGKQLHALYELSCNGTIEEDEYEKQTNAFYNVADEMASRLGLYIFYQTDPRGATIYLSKNEIKDNNYNSTAECIY